MDLGLLLDVKGPPGPHPTPMGSGKPDPLGLASGLVIPS